MFWNRKATPNEARTRQVGLDLNASRARAVSVLANRSRPVTLEEGREDLPLFVNLQQRPLRAGRTGQSLCRKLPHMVCANFLPLLGQAKQWQSGRLVVTPETALATCFEQLRPPLTAEAESLALALPAYLTPIQVQKILELARAARWPIVGSASTPVAITAHRAAYLFQALANKTAPLKPIEAEFCSVLVVDVDDYAFSVAVVQLEPRDVKLQAYGAEPKLSLKKWKECLLDALADRCVRVCRRDPRDSAEAEQILFDQLETAFEQAQNSQTVRLSIRSEHWYQDLVHPPEEIDGFCQRLAESAAKLTRETLEEASLPIPPRAIWLTHTASHLPGLAKALHEQSAQQTGLQSLPAQAAADAVAALIARWSQGELPKTHLDGVVPLLKSTSPSSKPVPQKA